MSEESYVRVLRDAAAASLDEVRTPKPGLPASRRWAHLREHMSPHTFIRLADAWLEREATAAAGRKCGCGAVIPRKPGCGRYAKRCAACAAKHAADRARARYRRRTGKTEGSAA